MQEAVVLIMQQEPCLCCKAPCPGGGEQSPSFLAHGLAGRRKHCSSAFSIKNEEVPELN